MKGNTFAIDILRDWSFSSAREAITERRASGESASIKKLAKHYFRSGRAANMDEATAMATRILR